VLRAASEGATPGKPHKQWQKEAEALMQKELLALGLLTRSEIRKQDPDNPALKKYFMHGVGHPLGLDVHDVQPTSEPIQPGWVLTVEPGIYLPKEGLAVRLENDILIREGGNVDLMADVPIEAAEIESLMRQTKRS
jgi:Xaa-Pro aminopeptidase